MNIQISNQLLVFLGMVAKYCLYLNTNFGFSESERNITVRIAMHFPDPTKTYHTDLDG
jgi:hypothetical protein